MRRAIAYVLDIAVFSPLVFLLYVFAELFTQRLIDYYGFFLILFPIAISFFEFLYNGVTPGKYIMRLKVITDDNLPVPFVTLFKRSVFITYFYPITAILLVVVFEIILRIPIYNLQNTYTALIFLLILTLPLACTLGFQSCHDYLFRTAVVSCANTGNIRLLSNRMAQLIGVSIVVIISGLVLTIHIHKNQVLKSASEQGIIGSIQQATSDQIDLTPSTSILEHNIDNIFEYYDYVSGYMGMRDLLALDESLGIQTPSIFSFNSKDSTDIPVYRVLVTYKGIANSRFKDLVSRNLLQHTIEKSGKQACVVEFLLDKSFFGFLSLNLTDTKVAVNKNHFDNLEVPYIAIISPRHGYELKLRFAVSYVNQIPTSENQKFMPLMSHRFRF